MRCLILSIGSVKLAGMSKVTIEYLRQRGRTFIGKDGKERIEVPLTRRQFDRHTREETIQAFLPPGVHLTMHAWNRFVVLVEKAPEAAAATSPSVSGDALKSDHFGAGVEIS